MPEPSESARAAVEQTLAHERVHHVWHRGWGGPANERLFERAFDRLLGEHAPPAGTEALDVGCGRGPHALRLARRGYAVHAVDVSAAVLSIAGANVRAAGLTDRITLGRQDVVDLAYDSERFDVVLCWGVLMHVPQIERAIVELGRVLAPGGQLIVHEGNVSAPEAMVTNLAKRLLSRADLRRTPAGIEHWKQTQAGPLLTRRMDIPWLIEAFERQGLRLRRRLATQLTELYAKPVGSAAKVGLHAANALWLERSGTSRLAVANTLLLEKAPAGS